MAEPIQGTLLDEADEALAESMLDQRPNMEIVSSADLLLKQVNRPKKKFHWKDTGPNTEQASIPEIEEQVKEMDAEEQRKREEALRLTPEQARALMDRMDSNLDEWISLMKYCDNLNPAAKIEEANLFLDRHEHNDRLFYLNGFTHMRRNAYAIIVEVQNKIIEMRPHGMNTYCHKCDRCHDAGECEHE